jgi:hypothetical protein
MSWELIAAALVNVVFAISAAALWSSCSSPKAKKVPRGAIRQRHDEFEIEPKDVPQFKPTWPSSSILTR